MPEKKQEPMTDQEWLKWYQKRVACLEDALKTHLNQRSKEGRIANAGLTPLQIEVRDQLLRAMLDLIPTAIASAKRGKPALLRLVCRTLRLKF